ncbi:MAG: YfcE family phosphodiesterase [Parasporobacterium sp.]|nr:YfcE family phosphodiesterase [Parasporobacterium sp.]
MKLLVLSDSHGHDENLTDIILSHPDAGAVIFLGDGEWDLDNALLACGIREEERIVCRVRGNCDRASLEPETIVREFGGVRFLITHGHEQNVKYGLWGLVDEAKKRNCKAALFGHTHRKTFLIREGVTLINPGSAAGGSYCLLEAENGIVKEPARQE